MPAGDEQAWWFFEDSGFATACVKGLTRGSPVLIAHAPEAAIRDAIAEVASTMLPEFAVHADRIGQAGRLLIEKVDEHRRTLAYAYGKVRLVTKTVTTLVMPCSFYIRYSCRKWRTKPCLGPSFRLNISCKPLIGLSPSSWLNVTPLSKHVGSRLTYFALCGMKAFSPCGFQSNWEDQSYRPLTSCAPLRL
jgi:hypothetical protein